MSDDATNNLLKQLEQQNRQILEALKRIEQYVQHIQPMSVDVQEVHREIVTLKSGLSNTAAMPQNLQQPAQQPPLQ